MRVDADPLLRKARDDFADDRLHLVGKRAAIGVAEHRPARAGVERRIDAGERVVRIGLVAVEKMLAVEQRLAAGGDRRRDRLRDAFEVLFVGAAERELDVKIPGLGDEADCVGLRAQAAPARPDRSPTERPARFTMPKAVNVARFVRLRSKKAVSVGLAPG